MPVHDPLLSAPLLVACALMFQGDAAMTTNRPTGEDWTPRGDWRSFLATLVSMVIYVVPWFVF